MSLITESQFGGDVAATNSTPVLLAVGDHFHGSIGTSGDHDLIGLDVVAGQTYQIALVGIATNMLTDTILQLRAADGVTLLDENDDGLRNNNSIITYTAEATGRVYIDASGYGTKRGEYGVTVAVNDRPSFDLAMIAGVIDNHSTWSTARATGTNLTYAFRESTSGGEQNFLQFTAGQITDTRAVLAHYAEVTGLTFTEVNAGGYSNNATLLYGNYSENDGAGGYGSYPGSRAATAVAGDVWVNDAAPSITPSGYGSWFRELMLHEIGHTLGLSHPGNYNAGVGVSITYTANADFAEDSSQYTLMSYFGGDETGATGGSPDTLMLADMLALQQMYGANMTTRTGATVYGFGSNAGDVYNFVKNLSPILTIWDAGGTDRLDASLFAMDQVLRLEAGAFSSTRGAVNNISVAWGVTLENATGGRGDDLIVGNTVANRLTGGWGDDTLSGAAGVDTLTGGQGADLVQGGLGNDVLHANGTAGGSAAVFDMMVTDYSAGTKLRANNVALSDGSFTIEVMWQQLALVDEHYSFDIGDLSLYRFNSGEFGLMFWEATTDDWNWDAVPQALTDGAAHRLSITYDDVLGNAKVYLDGALTWSASYTPGTRGMAATGNIVLDDDAAFGDLRFFNYARSDAEIWANAWTELVNPNADSGLLHYWTGDGAGHLISEIGGVNMTLVGATTSVQATPQVTGNIDTLEGGQGNDSHYIDSADDVIIEIEGGGTDTVYADVDYELNSNAMVEVLRVRGTDGVWLAGNEQDQRLVSAGGADTLSGGLGRDILDAGADLLQDVFLFRSVAEMGRGGARDILNRFDSGEDIVDLRDIDANTVLAGDQAFTFTAAASAFGAWLVTTTAGYLLRVDITGDAAADGEIRFAGINSVIEADIWL